MNMRHHFENLGGCGREYWNSSEKNRIEVDYRQGLGVGESNMIFEHGNELSDAIKCQEFLGRETTSFALSNPVHGVGQFIGPESLGFCLYSWTFRLGTWRRFNNYSFVCGYFSRWQKHDVKCKHVRVVMLSILHLRGVLETHNIIW